MDPGKIPDQLHRGERYDPWDVEKQRAYVELAKADECIRDHAEVRLARVGVFVVLVVLALIICAVYVEIAVMNQW